MFPTSLSGATTIGAFRCVTVAIQCPHRVSEGAWLTTRRASGDAPCTGMRRSRVPRRSVIIWRVSFGHSLRMLSKVGECTQRSCAIHLVAALCINSLEHPSLVSRMRPEVAGTGALPGPHSFAVRASMQPAFKTVCPLCRHDCISVEGLAQHQRDGCLRLPFCPPPSKERRRLSAAAIAAGRCAREAAAAEGLVLHKSRTVRLQTVTRQLAS